MVSDFFFVIFESSGHCICLRRDAMASPTQGGSEIGMERKKGCGWEERGGKLMDMQSIS